MASIKKYVGKKGIKYQITIYKGYMMDANGHNKQVKETITRSLDEMGISPVSEKGHPRTESKIERDVQLYADNYEKSVVNANYYKGDKIKFVDFYENSWKPWADSHFSASSYYTYTSHIEHIFIPKIGSLKIGKISAEQLSRIYQGLAKNGKNGEGYSRRSIVAFHKHLSSVMKLAYSYKIISDNPCENASLPKIMEEEKLKFLTPEQIKILMNIIEHPSPRVVTAFYSNWGKNKTSVYQFNARTTTKLEYDTYKVLFSVAIGSGCRTGELLALKWKDIDFDNKVIHIEKSVAYAKKMGGDYIKTPKTKTSFRSVNIPTEDIEKLLKLKTEQKRTILMLGTAWKGERDPKKLNENYVFPQMSGEIMYHGGPNRILGRLIDNYNATVDENDKMPKVTMHWFRHSHTSLLIAKGIDVKTIQTRLGHKNAQTTLNIYAHPLKERDIVATEVIEEALYKEKKIN